MQIEGNVDGALARLGVRPMRVGEVALSELAGIDRGIVTRWTASYVQLMPHGGQEIVRLLSRALTAAGIVEGRGIGPREAYPEARNEMEARMLAALARAVSPLAVDLLLAQPALWAVEGAESDPARDGVLARLIEPPLVVALGPTNIGKSTLVNALAGRAVAIVADEPGTTRDHVGVLLDLGGLVVRYVDTPGLREGAGTIETAAVELALQMARRADLLLLCGDATAAPPSLPPGCGEIERLVVATRDDLGEAEFAAEVRVGGLDRGQGARGLEELVGAVRERLVPRRLMEQAGTWRFWAEND